MRVLVAMGIFAELGPETYISTPIAEAFTIPAFRGASIHLSVAHFQFCYVY